jgi:sugar-phosphatase
LDTSYLDSVQRISVSGLLFDNDGVLVDSHAQVEVAWAELARRFDLDYEALAPVLIGRRAVDTLSKFLAGDVLAAAVDQLEIIEIEVAHDTPRIDGAAEFLRSLTIPWSVVTSATSPLASARWAGAGLAVPNAVITAEHVTEGKPDPEAYLRGAELIGVEPAEIVVFEDAPAGGVAARNAGCMVVAVGDLEWTIEPDARIPDLTHVRFDAAHSDVVIG